MLKFKRSMSLLLALIMVVTMTTGAYAADDPSLCANNESIVAQDAPSSANDGIMPLRTSYYYIVGNSNVPVDIYLASNIDFPLSGLVTINILDFNPVLYQIDIWVNDKHGLLWHEDNWTKLSSSNVFTAVNVTAISARIKPRAGWITPSKDFTVEIIY